MTTNNEPTPTIAAAIGYASSHKRQHHVVALHGIIPNTASCTCGAVCRTPGKHPRTDLSPHGARSGYTPPDVIATWPDTPDNPINIGIAMADGLYVIDIDDPHIADLLKDEDLDLAGETALAVTGRGLHIFLVSTNKGVSSFTIKNDKGEKIGDFLGDGKLAAVWPSAHASGRPRRWLGVIEPGEVMPNMITVDEPVEYVRATLASVGVTMADPGEVDVDLDGAGTAFVHGTAVNAIPLPEELLRGGLMYDVAGKLELPVGTLANEKDRSGSLWADARTVYRQTVANGAPCDTATLAGYTRSIDEALYQKYSGRSDAAMRYWVIAERVQATHASQNGATPQSTGVSANAAPASSSAQGAPAAGAAAPPPLTPLDHPYFWAEDAGYLFKRNANPNKPSMRICNFKPRIVRAYEVIDGSSKIHRLVFELTLRGGASKTAVVNQREATGGMNASLIASRFGPEFVVLPKQEKDVFAAAQLLSDGAIERGVVPSATGWYTRADGSPVYVLPNMAGITADGVDPMWMIDPVMIDQKSPILGKEYQSYGVDVRPAETPEERAAAFDALWKLMDAGDAAVTGPIVLGMLSGPLRAGPLANDAPFVHGVGKTGTLKTAYSLTALSLFGRFGRLVGTSAPFSWSSTYTALTVALSTLRHSVVFVDDFKSLIIDDRTKRGLGSLIQNYADGTTRSRMTSDMAARDEPIPYAAFVSSGEQAPSDSTEDGAMAARMIVAPFADNSIDPAKLLAAQEAVERGDVQRLGGTYIQWLARHPEIAMEPLAGRKRCVELEEALVEKAKLGLAHRRIAATAASLLYVGDVLLAFVQETFPEGEDAVVTWLKRVRTVVMKGLPEVAHDVAVAAPFPRFADAVLSAMPQYLAYFRALDERKVPVDEVRWPNGMTSANTKMQIGYYEDNSDGDRSVLLIKGITWEWMKHWHGRDGLPFTWRSLRADLLAHGAVECWAHAYDRDNKPATLRALRLSWRMIAPEQGAP